MEETVFLNGNFLAAKEARLPVASPGFLYGIGLFETMRSYNGNIVYFDEHLIRIKHSCKFVKIHFPHSLITLKKYIRAAVERNGLKDARVRMTLWKKGDKTTNTLIVAGNYNSLLLQKYKAGFSCLLSEARINENNFFVRLKSTNYLLNQLVYRQAKGKGLDEAIMLNSQGDLAEGSRSNIFFVRDNRIFTPALECGCLDGITRKAVFDLAKENGFKLSEGRFSLSNLLSAEEAFLTNSMIGIMPFTRIGKTDIGKGVFKLTNFLMKRYNLLLLNGTKKDK